MYTKSYFLVEVITTTGIHHYYGKNSKEIILGRQDNIPWYIKEYGFDTAESASKEIKKLSQWYHNCKLYYTQMKVVETKVVFEN